MGVGEKEGGEGAGKEEGEREETETVLFVTQHLIHTPSLPQKPVVALSLIQGEESIEGSSSKNFVDTFFSKSPYHSTVFPTTIPVHREVKICHEHEPCLSFRDDFYTTGSPWEPPFP